MALFFNFKIHLEDCQNEVLNFYGGDMFTETLTFKSISK